MSRTIYLATFAVLMLACLGACGPIGPIGPIITGGLVGGSMGFRHDGGAPVEYR